MLPVCVATASTVPAHTSKSGPAANAKNCAVTQMANNAYIVAENVRCDLLRVEADDGVCYSDDALMLVGETLRGSPGDNTFVIRDIRLSDGLFCARAKFALHTEKGGKRRIVLRHGEIFCGEPGPCTPSVSSERIFVDDMNYLRFRGATFKIGNHSVFYLPYYSTSVQHVPLEARIHYGRQERLGFFGRHQFLFQAGSHAKYGLNADFYTRRGILLGPTFDLEFPTWQARFRSGFMHDGNASLSDIYADAKGKSRNFLKLNYNQKIRSNFNLYGAFEHTSDDRILRDFMRKEFLQNQFPDNFLETSYTQQNDAASILVRSDPSSAQRTVERLPQLRYERVAVRFLHIPAYYSAFCELAHLKLRHDSVPSVFRAETYCGVDFLLKWQNFLTFKPLLGQRATFYHLMDEKENYLQNRLQIGWDLRMDFCGDWGVSLPKWELYNICHRVTPILQYRRTWQRKRECPVPIDMKIANSAIPIINLAERKDADDSLAMHVLRLGVENLFQSMKNKTRRHTFAELSFFEDLHFQNFKGGSRWSDLYTTLSLLPGEFLSMQLFSQIDVMRLIVNDLHAYFSIHDAMLWRLSLSHNFFKGESNQYGLHFNYRLNCNNWIGYFLRYDVSAHGPIHQHYKFRHRVNNSWCWNADLTIRSKTFRGDRYQVSVGMSLPK
ncbi:MAG: LPS assembly protein LptD [Puniceicoccales bacterium]|nr:LPS assembly protein LptD [Puniceicoccales bacterium]